MSLTIIINRNFTKEFVLCNKYVQSQLIRFMDLVTHENWFDSCTYHSMVLGQGEDGLETKVAEVQIFTLISQLMRFISIQYHYLNISPAHTLL